jgi:predicted O-methyltransferase YrrM
MDSSSGCAVTKRATRRFGRLPPSLRSSPCAASNCSVAMVYRGCKHAISTREKIHSITSGATIHPHHIAAYEWKGKKIKIARSVDDFKVARLVLLFCSEVGSAGATQGDLMHHLSPSGDLERWDAVDQYIVSQLIEKDPVLQEVLLENSKHGLPPHDVSPTQGRFLHLLARAIGAKNILEIGTLGAYSTIWLARALQSSQRQHQDASCVGRVVTIEYDPKHAAVAHINIKRAGLEHLVDLRVGAALDILPQLQREQLGPFDLVFIDADKPNNPSYLSWALQLSRPGTVIIGDNVVRDGQVADARSLDDKVLGVREFFRMMKDEPRIAATALQTVGSKGYDGFSFAVIQDQPRVVSKTSTASASAAPLRARL